MTDREQAENKAFILESQHVQDRLPDLSSPDVVKDRSHNSQGRSDLHSNPFVDLSSDGRFETITIFFCGSPHPDPPIGDSTHRETTTGYGSNFHVRNPTPAGGNHRAGGRWPQPHMHQLAHM